MDGYTVEIDELHDDSVVLIVRALRLLVFGRTLDEAMARAEASIGFGLLQPAVTGQWTSQLADQALNIPGVFARNAA